MKNREIEAAALSYAIESFNEGEPCGFVTTEMIVARAEEFAGFLRSNRIGPVHDEHVGD